MDTIKELGEEKCIFTMYVKKKRIYVYLAYKYITNPFVIKGLITNNGGYHDVCVCARAYVHKHLGTR